MEVGVRKVSDGIWKVSDSVRPCQEGIRYQVSCKIVSGRCRMLTGRCQEGVRLYRKVSDGVRHKISLLVSFSVSVVVIQ